MNRFKNPSRCLLAAWAAGLSLAALASCGGSSAGSSSVHAEITRCYIDGNALPQAEVTLDGAEPGGSAYSATVDFHIVGDPDFADSFLVWLEAPTGGSAHGTTEVSPLEPLLEGENVTCALKELREHSFDASGEAHSRKIQGEGPEVSPE